MAKRYFLIEVYEELSPPRALTNRDVSIILVAFTLCTTLIAFCVSFHLVDSTTYQNFRYSIFSDEAYIILLVISCIVEFIVILIFVSHIRGGEIFHLRPNLTSVMASIGILICFGYGSYEYTINYNVLKESKSEFHFWTTTSQTKYSYVNSRSMDIETLTATSTNSFSVGFCPTVCSARVNSDNTLEVFLEGEHLTTINQTDPCEQYKIKIGNSDAWRIISLTSFQKMFSGEYTAYYLDHLYDDVMSTGSFSLKIPTNIGELEYHFTNN